MNKIMVQKIMVQKNLNMEFFSTIPNFRQILRKKAEIFMDPYKINNEDLDENNFAKLFIYRIVNDINLEKKLTSEEKISKLDAFLYCLLLIYQKNSKFKKNTVKDVKEAYVIIVSIDYKFKKK